jgi:solute carrier family 44 (choline transporter-like protein), member 2/4/5
MSKNEVAPEKNDAGKPVNKFMDPNYKGEPLNPQLADGPVMNRGCTDCLCCILFVAFIGAWLAIGFYGFAHGDPMLLTYPFNMDNHQCGRPGSLTESYPYLYYAFPFPGTLHYRICVKNCPTSSGAAVSCWYNTSNSLESQNSNATVSCQFKYSDWHVNYANAILGVYTTDTYLSRFCLPLKSVSNTATSAYSNVVGALDISTIQKYIGDVFTVWEVMFIVAGAALVFCFVYMIFLRFCVGFIVWTSIFFTLGFIIVLAAFFQWASYNLYNSDTDGSTIKNLQILAYVLYGISGVLLIYILYMCNKIRLAVAIMKVGTQYIRDVWLTLLIPPIFFVLTVGLYIYWTLACLYLYSSGTLTQRGTSANPFATVNWGTTERAAFYFEFWGILWTNAILIALEQFILASSVCIWYFSVNSDSGPQRPISRSVWRAFRYHLGSLAFGSLILAIVWTIKYILMYIQGKIKAANQTQNSRVVEWLLKIVTCYVLCLERFIKFLNKNAYIQIALNATSFCTACRDAFFLILRNASRFLAVGSIGSVFMFLGKWVVSLGAAYVGYMLITKNKHWAYEIHSPILPTVVFILIAYAISALFMSIYGMACDTILQCFLADEELSSQNRGGPSHSPELLTDFMGRERQKDQSARCCDCC